MAYADLILPLPLAGTFTWLIPKELEGDVRPGKRVLVQFGSKKIYSAVVRKIHDDRSQDEEFELKAILSVLDSEPVVTETQLEFWDWISDYYMCTGGEVLKAAMPSGLRLGSETRLVTSGYAETAGFNDKEYLIFRLIENKPLTTIKELSAAAGDKPVHGIVKGLIDKKAVLARESLKESYKPKTETWLKLHPFVDSEGKLLDIMSQLEKAPKQLELLHAYLRLSGFSGFTTPPQLIRKDRLPANLKGNNAPLRALLEKNIISEIFLETSRLPVIGQDVQKLNKLNRFQDEALRNIKMLFETKAVVLLNGITSGGKTEIYMHIIRDEIEKGRQVLYLLPEIALTTQIITRLKNIFGEKAGVYHSRFSDPERVEIWNRVLGNGSQRYQLILGVRSALFLPFKDLGLVIVDEEHENTFKQFDPAPRYHARDAAIMLASVHGAKTLLGTATPSVESYFNALSGKFGLVNLTRRYKEIALPEVIVADTREARKRKKMKSLFTPQLYEAIEHALLQKEQVILFQNRRGYAPYLECNDCGWIPACKFCDVSMTYHKGMSRLICHYCGASERSASVCPDCNGSDIKTRGFGTEKIEDEISIYFPDAMVGRLDLDSTRKKKAYEKIIADFESGHLDILIGTQMIAKGLDFDRVSLVGILNADNLLFFPDFRAHERSFQLIQQVSGRAGRKTKQGKVIIQTGFPGHPVIKNIVANDFAKNFNEQITERQQFIYPPFVRLFRIVVKDIDKAVAAKAAANLASNLKKKFGNRVLGPEFPLVGRVQNRYIKHILVKIEKGANLPLAKRLIAAEIAEIQSRKEFKTCTVYPDVDPF
jgi:primosomal protein N' (replication factor Y) (superfamily II helicase)